jgi:hypothetical protein
MNPSTQAPTQSNPMLEQLRDIHLPDAVSWWPIAWPWWLILTLAITLLCFAVYYRKKNAWRKKALTQLNHFDKIDSVQHAMQCNRLLKQICFNKIDRSCASLSGAAWLSYLDQQLKTPIFSTTLESFASILDNPNASIDSEQLTSACRQWIRKAKC